MGGAGSGSGGLFGPRFTKPQREFVRQRLEEAGWVWKRVTASLHHQFMAEFGETRSVASVLRLLKRLAEKHARDVERLRIHQESRERTGPTLKGVSKQRTRSYDGPTRFSPAEEQAIVSAAPDCVVVEHTIDYDALIRRLDEIFTGRRSKWNRDGIRAVLKRHGVYDRLLQGERPVPIVVRPPSDPLKHLRLLKGVLEGRMDRVRSEFARLHRAHRRVCSAIEAYEADIGTCGLDDLAAAEEDFARIAPAGKSSEDPAVAVPADGNLPL